MSAATVSTVAFVVACSAAASLILLLLYEPASIPALSTTHCCIWGTAPWLAPAAPAAATPIAALSTAVSTAACYVAVVFVAAGCAAS